LSKLIKLINRDPTWDNKSKSYKMPFSQRVIASSPKNFQLIEDPSISDKTLLQFGKYKNNVYNIDIMHPLSIFQGFAIALTVLDQF